MFISRRRLQAIELSLDLVEARILRLEKKVGHDYSDFRMKTVCWDDTSEDVSGLYKRIDLLAKELGYEYNDVEIIEGFTKIKKG